MAYQALYRKYRPPGFDAVVGQDHIVRTLKRQIISRRVTHAYLLCGTRGTGKTSIAKIFAKAINCDAPVDGSPCGECSSCVNIAHERSMNVIEIDAASNNGVDNIREIRDEVRYTPTEGTYKVYIIDEVHMLSSGAFNALLKTLEEPPEHVIFILATTDPQKIPSTVLSRCQRFDFKRISAADMVTVLKEYLDKEQVTADDNALRYIATLSDGAMRDALNMLDQCISFYAGENITLDIALEVMGSVDNTVRFQLADALNNGDAGVCLQIVDELILGGKDINQFVSEFLTHLRNMLITATTATPEAVLDMSSEHIQRYREGAAKLRIEKLMQWIRIFSEHAVTIKYADNPRIMLEVLLIKLCNPTLDESYDGLFARLDKLEREMSQRPVVTVASDTAVIKKKETPKKKEPKLAAAAHEDIQQALKLWDSIKTGFGEAVDSITNESTAGYLEDNFLYIICTSKIHADILSKKVELLSEKLLEKTGKKFMLKAISKTEFTYRYNNLHGTADSQEDDPEFDSLIKSLDENGIEYTIE